MSTSCSVSFFFSDDRKQDDTNITTHSKRLIEIFKCIFTSALSIICENTDGCAEQYRCVSSLYPMSVLSQCYSIIIDCGISAHGHGKEVVYGMNVIGKRYIYIS